LALTSKIPMAVIALVAVIGGLGTGMAASLGMADGSPLMQGADDESALADADILVMHNLGGITVNLSEPGGSRLLRMKLAVEATQTTSNRLSQIEPRVRDDLIRFISDRTYGSLEGTAGKEQFRTELLAHINGVLEPETVENVYFHSFVVH